MKVVQITLSEPVPGCTKDKIVDMSFLQYQETSREDPDHDVLVRQFQEEIVNTVQLIPKGFALNRTKEQVVDVPVHCRRQGADLATRALPEE